MSARPQYQDIFSKYGNRKELAAAIKRTRAARGLSEDTIYTGLSAMMSGRRPPSPKLVAGLRERFRNNPQLDALLHEQYGIAPAQQEIAKRASKAPKQSRREHEPTPYEEYTALFRQHGFDTRASVSRAVQQTGPAKHLQINGIHTGLREMVYGKRKPTVSILMGLREALSYAPELDRLLQQQYGIEPATRPKRIEEPAIQAAEGPVVAKPAAAHLEELLTQMSQFERLVTQINTARDAAFAESYGKLRKRYDSTSPDNRIGVYRKLEGLVDELGIMPHQTAGSPIESPVGDASDVGAAMPPEALPTHGSAPSRMRELLRRIDATRDKAFDELYAALGRHYEHAPPEERMPIYRGLEKLNQNLD